MTANAFSRAISAFKPSTLGVAGAKPLLRTAVLEEPAASIPVKLPRDGVAKNASLFPSPAHRHATLFGSPRITATSLACRSFHDDRRKKGGPGLPSTIRNAHTDVKIPNYNEYRKPDSLNPAVRKDQEERNLFHYFMMTNVAWTGCWSAKMMAEMFVTSMSASSDVVALAKIEVKLDTIPEGKNITFTWRGKPLFVRHRTEKEISDVRAVDVNSLRDPEKDEDRVVDPKFLVLVGICTHLGCVPIAGLGDFGGYYCPCHGSHFDCSGRVRKGPAPINLEVPVHEIQDNLLIVG
jgi:ubiquinol-cytochrome c reductase iron-sulfur subunit